MAIPNECFRADEPHEVAPPGNGELVYIQGNHYRADYSDMRDGPGTFPEELARAGWEQIHGVPYGPSVPKSPVRLAIETRDKLPADIQFIPLDRAAGYKVIKVAGELRIAQADREYTMNGVWQIITVPQPSGIDVECYLADEATMEACRYIPNPDTGPGGGGIVLLWGGRDTPLPGGAVDWPDRPVTRPYDSPQ